MQEKQIVAEELKEKERAKDLEKREKARCSKFETKLRGRYHLGSLHTERITPRNPLICFPVAMYIFAYGAPNSKGLKTLEVILEASRLLMTFPTCSFLVGSD